MAAAQSTFFESEPNNSKATANPVLLLPGERIVGNSTGTSTSIAGAASADYFLVRTSSAPPGIYAYRLSLATGSAGAEHTASLRGLYRNVSPSDAALQSTSASGERTLQWYGFGRSEQIYIRVTGTASSTSEYSLTLESSPVRFTDLGQFPGGLTRITSLGQGHSTDTDLWVHNADLYAILDFGNDNAPYPNPSPHALLARDFLFPGAYYLAITSHELVNGRWPAPDDSRQFFPSILDFGDGAVGTAATPAENISFVIIDNTGAAHPVAAARAAPYEIAWYRFQLDAPMLGACCLADGTCTDGGSSGSCAWRGGVYQGDGSACAAIACPQPPSGACCFSNGTCALTSSFVCAAAGQLWQGPGTVCGALPCPPPPPCYPNCDLSTNPPVLNVQDFVCFLQRFASQEVWANCDASTTAPYLNVQDFSCFLQRYAAGCP